MKMRNNEFFPSISFSMICKAFNKSALNSKSTKNKAGTLSEIVSLIREESLNIIEQNLLHKIENTFPQVIEVEINNYRKENIKSKQCSYYCLKIS